MAKPTLTPASTINAIVLPVTGNIDNISSTLPYGMYSAEETFLQAAKDQVAYVYKKLGGDVLNVELTEGNVYAAYEEAVLEYSYIVNIHQAKNSLGDLLGTTTASFDQDGEIKVGDDLAGKNVESKYPRFTFHYAQRVGDGVADRSSFSPGGAVNVYSASLNTTNSIQDYDLQDIVYSASIDSSNSYFPFYGKVGQNKITIKQMYYKTNRASWRFFAYYGGLNVIGNLHSYGQYSDDSTFEVIPAWQNKLQAIQYEDSINTRVSHFSYEIFNNKLRIFPRPTDMGPSKFWFRFIVENEKDPWEESDGTRKRGIDGVNNINTLPYANIKYITINSIGKQWIRRFALALCKEMLGQIRGKLGGVIPIPGDTITLNSGDLLGQGKDEQDKLREELKTILDELTYAKLAEKDAAILESATKTQGMVPLPIFVG
tara:strand:- start:59 stop:1345 length:1287 start_codon:yes stop_codon:yes gene_type:complete